MEKVLDNWLAPQVEEDKEKENLVEEPEEDEDKRKSQWELLKEEIIGEIKIIMRKNEKMTYIEVRADDLTGKKIDGGFGFPQFFTILKDDDVDGPRQAKEYFQGLGAWFKGGRKGPILPFQYQGES